MDIGILREYKVLSERLNFTASAKATNISQSVFSRHMKALEIEVGYQLIDRSHGSVALTPEGSIFAETVNEILEKYDSCLKDLDRLDMKANNSLKISYDSRIDNFAVRNAYSEFLRKYHDADIRLISTWEKEVLSLLDQDEVDIAFLYMPVEPDSGIYSSMTMYEDTYSLVVPINTKGSIEEPIDLNDIKDKTLLIPSEERFPYLSKQLSSVFASRDDLKVLDDLHDIYDLSALVSAKRGWALAPTRWTKGIKDDLVKVVPIKNSDLTCRVIAMWKKDNPNRMLKSFVDRLGDPRIRKRHYRTARRVS